MAGAAVLAACALAASIGGSQAATGSSVVGATILSATNLSTTACASGVAGKTDFGNVTAGSSLVTTVDCDLTWGSSNDTSMLRMFQTDGRGSAFWRPTIGTLDTTFDGDGRASTVVGGVNAAYAGAVQADGKLVLAGSGIGGNQDFGVARFDTAGALDTSFDTDGTTLTAIGAAAEYAMSVAIQPDGKIVTVGKSHNGANQDFAVVRYNTDGSLDTSFNGTGKLSIDVTGGNDEGTAVAIQPDGKILVGGSVWGGATDWDFRLVRLTASGALDTTFNGTGKSVQADFGGDDEVTQIALQPDGKILTVGYNNDTGAPFQRRFAISRHNADGTLDTAGWNASGKVTAMIGTYDTATSIAVQPDGKVVAFGQEYDGAKFNFGLARFDSTGALDATFGTGGKVGLPFGALSMSAAGTYGGNAMSLLPDGRIVAVGTNGGNLYLARYQANGTLDTSLNATGYVSIPSGGGTQSVVALNDGALAVVGIGGMGAVKLSGIPVADYDDDNIATDSNWSEGTNMFAACLRAVGGSGVVGTWTVAGTCSSGNAAYWNPVATTSAASGAKVAASPTATTTTATTSLRFGLRTAASQAPGAYIAPITFEVLAPNA